MDFWRNTKKSGMACNLTAGLNANKCRDGMPVGYHETNDGTASCLKPDLKAKRQRGVAMECLRNTMNELMEQRAIENYI